jgi:hypothetical protein
MKSFNHYTRDRSTLDFSDYIIEGVENSLIVIDVQPEYESAIPFNMATFTNWLNTKEFKNITFLFNGADTLGMIEETDLKMWYMEHGLDEDVIYSSDWYDKGYAFFRYCMDIGIDESDIVSLVVYMKENGINDSREIDESVWDAFVEKYDAGDVRELMEHADDMIHIPDVMEYLERLGNNLIIVGGGANECLKEIEIALQANRQSFNRISEWVY